MAVHELRLVLTFRDFDRATRFFGEALGLEQIAEFHQDGGRGVLYDAGRATLEVFDEAQAQAVDSIEVGRRSAGQIRVAFHTDDSEESARALIQAGAQVLGGPMVTPWGDRNVRLAAPEGIQLTLFSPASD